MNALVNNPFATAPVAAAPSLNSPAIAEQQRAIAEVQAALLIAQTYPRNQVKSMDKILSACTRASLAESAVYSFNRGGSEVTGPSIRLAEAIAQEWGNIQFGIREVSQQNGKSTVQAFAWDIETNTKNVKEFDVPHIRYTKHGTKKLEDPRDIYEMIANQGARRLRSCILSVIPGDVIESAVKQCEVTMSTKADISPENIKKMADKFLQEYGVTTEMIQKRIGRRLESMNAAQMVQMRKIYNSLRDGMSSPADWFEMQLAQHEADETKNNVREAIKEKLAARNKKHVAPESDELINEYEKEAATNSDAA
jgi:hypothetical protein